MQKELDVYFNRDVRSIINEYLMISEDEVKYIKMLACTQIECRRNFLVNFFHVIAHDNVNCHCDSSLVSAIQNYHGSEFKYFYNNYGATILRAEKSIYGYGLNN